MSEISTDTGAHELGGIARAASVIALGNVTSRVLGLVRETVKAHFFGTGAHVDALTVALIIPNQIYELVTGGLVNSALVPVFSDYADPKRRPELWHLVSILCTLGVLLLSAFLLLVVWLAPVLAGWIAAGAPPEGQALTASLLRITLPAVLFLSLSGILTGLLYSLKRFTAPAFTAAVFNLVMVVGTLALHARLNVAAMALGLLAGAVMQVAIQLPVLRDVRFRPSLDLRHPGLRRILRLYLPIILGLVVTQASIYIGLRLASLTGERGISWMNYATTLYQFPLGLVATAISFAVLPSLARQANDAAGFKQTLGQGMNLVIVLIVPATVGLFVLARPIVGLLFESGEFNASDTLQTARVLQFFLIGLSFAALDQLLIFAFYARKNTFTPAMVGVFSVALYLIVALALIRPMGLLGLMVADSAKQIFHALVTGGLLARQLGGGRAGTFWATAAKALTASAILGAGAWASLQWIGEWGLPAGRLGHLPEVVVPGLVGVVLYTGLIAALRVPEIQLLWGMVRARLSRARVPAG